MSEQTATSPQPETGVLSRSLDVQAFDDRIDTDTDISTLETLALIWRGMQLIGEVRYLLLGKTLLMGVALPFTLMVPWILKILIDNVVLGAPIGSSEVPYPPFMDPFLTFMTGMSPMEVMLTLAVWFLFMTVIIGHRNGGEATGPGLYSGGFGADVATKAENETSLGWSDAGGLFGYFEFLITVRLSQGITNSIRTRLFRRLTLLPMTTLDDQRIGDSIYRVLYDASSVPKLCVHLTVGMGFMLITALITMYLIQYSYGEVAPEAVWLAWSLVPITFLGSIPLARVLRRLSQNKRAAGSATTNAIEESMGNVAAVQSLGGTEQERDRFAERSRESFFRERLEITIVFGLLAIAAVIALAAVIYLTIVVTDEIIDGNMTPGDLGVMLGVFTTLTVYAIEMGAFWYYVQDPAVALRRIFFYIDHASDSDHPGSVEIDSIRDRIELQQASLEYPNGFQALRNVDLTLRHGELTALVGPTGAGKTSLAYLIPGFLQPTSGRITFDGRDIKELDLNALRDQVTYVFQEHLLLSESVRANLLLAKPDASTDELNEALERASAEFVHDLPEGIETVLGAGGGTLSVGQQQRLCIARGLLRNTPVLILDEPTAALDPAAENELIQSLKQIREGRLVVVIAHRLSTIRHADRIVFMQDGEVEAVGTHEDLMSTHEAYRRYVELQGG